jgi:hypothetical protein
LLYTLLHHSAIGVAESVIGLSDESSFVSYEGKWIDLKPLSISSAEPLGLRVLFNANEVKIKKLITEPVEVGS